MMQRIPWAAAAPSARRAASTSATGMTKYHRLPNLRRGRLEAIVWLGSHEDSRSGVER